LVLQTGVEKIFFASLNVNRVKVTFKTMGGKSEVTSERLLKVEVTFQTANKLFNYIAC